jgi:cytochrome P460
MTRALVLAFALAALPLESSSVPAPAPGPRFAGDALVLPAGYDTWPIVGASLGLSYSANADNGPGTFHRVYMSPSSYQAFKRTGQFPEGTLFVLESYQAEERKSIAKGGYVEGQRVGVDASVKDHSRFPGGWAYFNFNNGASPTATAFPDAQCHSCHKAHADIDSVFVQFYPNLRSR